MYKILIGLLIMGVTIITDDDLNLFVSGDVRSAINTDLAIFKTSLDIDTQLLMNEVKKFTVSHSDLSQKEILRQLSEQQKGMTGVFSLLKNSVLKDYKKKVYEVDSDIFFGDIEGNILGQDASILYTWQAVFVRTCKSCQGLHGTRYTLSDWDATGGRPKTRDTLCDGHCKCNLIPSDVMPSKKEMQKPVKIASEKVRKAEKIRGKKYSIDYATQLTGTFNSPDYRLKDLRKVKKV